MFAGGLGELGLMGEFRKPLPLTLLIYEIDQLLLGGNTRGSGRRSIIG
jgi:hypothetical protein